MLIDIAEIRERIAAFCADQRAEGFNRDSQNGLDLDHRMAFRGLLRTVKADIKRGYERVDIPPTYLGKFRARCQIRWKDWDTHNQVLLPEFHDRRVEAFETLRPSGRGTTPITRSTPSRETRDSAATKTGGFGAGAGTFNADMGYVSHTFGAC